MKITIEAHGRTYSAELEDDIGAINQAVRGLLVAVGYHTNTVDEYFPNWEDYQELEKEEPHPWEKEFRERREFTQDKYGYFNFKNKETPKNPDEYKPYTATFDLRGTQEWVEKNDNKYKGKETGRSFAI